MRLAAHSCTFLLSFALLRSHACRSTRQLLPAGNGVGGRDINNCTGVAFCPVCPFLTPSISNTTNTTRDQQTPLVTAVRRLWLSRTEPFGVPAQTSCRLEDLQARGPACRRSTQKKRRETQAYQRCDVHKVTAWTRGTFDDGACLKSCCRFRDPCQLCDASRRREDYAYIW